MAAAYAELCRLCGTDGCPWPCGPRPPARTPPDASFAGEHDTYLWVRGADEVLATSRGAGRACSPTGPSPTGAQTGYADDVVAMSVGVQKMVRPIASGVAFTLNPPQRRPLPGRHRRHLGLRRGGRLRRGHPGQLPGRQGDRRDHQPDDLATRQSRTGWATATGSSGSPVDEARRTAPLPHRRRDQGDRPAGPARGAALRLPPGHRVGPRRRPGPRTTSSLLQSRPETVWSRKAGHARRRRRLPVASIVSTLCRRCTHVGTLGQRPGRDPGLDGQGQRHGGPLPEPVRDRRRPRGPRAGRSSTPTRCCSPRTAATTRTRCSGSRTASTGRRS